MLTAPPGDTVTPVGAPGEYTPDSVGATGVSGKSIDVADCKTMPDDNSIGGIGDNVVGVITMGVLVIISPDDEPDVPEGLLAGIILVNIGVFQLDWLPEVWAVAVLLMVIMAAIRVKPISNFFMIYGLTG